MKKTSFAILLVALSTTLAVGGTELVLRFLLRAWPFEEPMQPLAHLTPQESMLRWRIAPGPGRNSLGLYGREIDEKDPASLRVLVLGDSLVWGGKTTSGAHYTETVERNLNTEGRARVQVINAGVPGYTTYQELEFLRLHGLAMKPDLVVLGFVFNDVYYPYLHRHTARRFLAREPTILLHRFDTRGLSGWLVGRSYLAHQLAFTVRLAHKMLRGEPRFAFDRREDVYLAWMPHGWDDAARLLGEMRALLASRAIRFAMLIFPVVEQVDTIPGADDRYVLYPQQRLHAICRALDVQCLDLTPTFRAHGGRRLYRDYLHLNEAGNDIVAAQLTRFVHTELLAETGANRRTER